MAEQWEVTAQTQIQTATAGGQFGTAVRVDYKTKPDGVVGWVQVPMPDYTPEKVHALIQGEVDKHLAIRAL